MPGLFWLKWFPGDFMTATVGWSVTARGVYRELLDAQWLMGSLPSTPQELQKLIRATDAEWRLGWKRCEAKFPIIDGERRNERLDTIRADALEKSSKGSDKARGAATARWQRYREAKTLAAMNAQSNATSINNHAPSNAILESESDIRKDPESKSAKSANGHGSRPIRGPRKTQDLPLPPGYPVGTQLPIEATLAKLRARAKPV